MPVEPELIVCIERSTDTMRQRVNSGFRDSTCRLAMSLMSCFAEMLPGAPNPPELDRYRSTCKSSLCTEDDHTIETGLPTRAMLVHAAA